MGFILRRIVYVIALTLGTFTYLALQPLSGAMDAALCVGYTAFVAGRILSGKNSPLTASQPTRPIQEMLLIHAGFLAGIVAMVRGVILASPYLPPQFTQSEPGHHGPWTHFCEVAAVLGLFYWERSLLLRAPAPKKSAAETQAGVKSQEVKTATISSSAVGTLGSEQPATLPAAPAPVAPVPAAAPTPASHTSVMDAPMVPPPVIKPRNDPEPGALYPVATYKMVPVAESPVYSFASQAHAAEKAAGSHSFDSSSGDEYEDFIVHMKSGKRPFRKPGISIKEEFELWHAARHKANTQPPPQRNGLGRFLQVGRNFN